MVVLFHSESINFTHLSLLLCMFLQHLFLFMIFDHLTVFGSKEQLIFMMTINQEGLFS